MSEKDKTFENQTFEDVLKENRVLVSIETVKIKDFIFSTNKLKLIRGASYLLDYMNQVEVPRILKKYGLEYKTHELVNKIYNNKVNALKNINLKVEEGDIYGIIGYSGAGKSTLVRLLNGLEIATDGEVIIEGDDFNKITESERRLKRQRIGMIFQHFNLLWSRTVAENIAFPLEILGKSKNEIKERVE